MEFTRNLGLTPFLSWKVVFLAILGAIILILCCVPLFIMVDGLEGLAMWLSGKGLLQNAVFRPKRKIYLLKKLSRTKTLTVLANFFGDIIFENSILQQAHVL